MACLRRFLLPVLGDFHTSKLHRHCLHLRKGLISNGDFNEEILPSNNLELDILNGKIDTETSMNYKCRFLLAKKKNYIYDSEFSKTSLKKQCFVPNGKPLVFISHLLEDVSLNRKKIFEISYKLYLILQSNKFSNENVNAFISRNDIKNLFSSLEKYLHESDTRQIQTTLRLCLLCQFPACNSLMQKTLILALDNINKFSPWEILSVYLDILGLGEESECVKLLKLACLNYMVHCFKDKVKQNSSSDTLAYFLGKKALPGFIRLHIKNMLSGHDLNAISSNTLLHLMRGINLLNKSHCDIKFNKKVQQILKTLMCEENDRISVEFVLHYIRFYTMGVHFDSYQYDEELCDKFASCVISGSWDFLSACEVMESLCNIHHLNVPLCNYVFRKCTTAEINEESAIRLLGILSKIYFTQLDDNTKDFLRKKFELYDFSCISSLHRSIFPYGEITMGLSLAEMGICRKEIIEMTLKTVTDICDNPHFSENHSLVNLQEAILLYQWVCFLNPRYKNKLSENLLERCYILLTKNDNFLLWQDVLLNTFGKDYIFTGCITPLKPFPSYVVVLGPGNKPLNLSSYKEATINIEMIEVPENSKIVVIQEVSEALSKEFKNVPLSYPKHQIYLKILNNLGCNVVVLEQKKFSKLPKPLRKLYVTSKFEEKFGKIDFDNRAV